MSASFDFPILPSHKSHKILVAHKLEAKSEFWSYGEYELVGHGE